MKKFAFVLTIVMILTLALAGNALAITNGQPDNGAHPYVGLIVADDAPGHPAWRCSGSLIAPTIVLTAGHCTNGAVAARFWIYEDMTYNHVPYPLYPYGGPGSGATEGTAYTNPNLDVGSPYKGVAFQYPYRDIGIVVLDQPIYLDKYAELPEVGLVDTLKNMTAIDYVGYGVQDQAQIPGNELPQPPGYPPPFYRWVGLRVRLFAPAALVSGKFVNAADFMALTLNPGGGTGGFCFGDSGGPDLLGGTNTVLAVNSYVTNPNCTGIGYSARVDTPDALAWIDSFLP
jgi:hypothetical protein